MRRLLSILMLVLFGLGPVAPLLAVGPGADANLPACCRRGGAHHCAMSMGLEGGTKLVAVCPAWGKRGVATPHEGSGWVASASDVSVAMPAGRAVAWYESEVWLHFEESWSGRGPPVERLS